VPSTSRRPLLVLVPALVLVAQVAAAATPGKITKERFAFKDRVVSYYLFVPKSVGGAAKAPVIVLLHGSGRNGSSLAEPWKDLADKEGIVLVAPDAVDTRQWLVPGDGPEPLCALVEELRKTLPLDPRRIYLFGHSAGAVFALYMSVLESEYFAAASIHAGALRSPGEFLYLDAMTRPIPIAIAVGDRDAFFPLAAVNNTIDAFQGRGAPIQADIIKGHDHNYYAIADKVNAAAWAFLKGRSLDADPKYAQHDIK
jgi:poly(3-hydroxybutyrate) depolymerase